MSDNKVYLINLPSPFMINEKIHMPLGLMYIHEFLRTNGVENIPQIIDLSGKTEDEWDIPEDGMMYAISATTPQYNFAKKIKERLPGKHIWIGGIHASALPEQCRKDGFYVVEGEGESKFWMCVYRGVMRISNIDDYPFPKLESLDTSDYNMRLTFNFQGKIVERNAGWLISSRGCPHNCSFCGSHCMWNSRVRFHSIEYLSKWIDYWKEKDINDFYFIDENIGVSKKRLFAICDLMKSTGGYWRGLMRGDGITEERAKRMYDSGCRQITIGVETGSQRLLDICNKNEKVEDNAKAIKILHENGIGVKASMMVGLPTENEADVVLSEMFIKENPCDEFNVFAFVPHPGSDIYHNPEKYNYDLDYSIPFEKYVCTEDVCLEKGKGDIVKQRRKRLLDTIGDKYLLEVHKDRWKEWAN